MISNNVTTLCILCIFLSWALPCVEGAENTENIGSIEGAGKREIGPSAEETQSLIFLNQLRADPIWETERILFGAQGGISGMRHLDHEKCRQEMVQLKPVPPLVYNMLLTTSARHHARYMIINNTVNHDERQGHEGFTGVSPAQRIIAVRYPGMPMGENVYRNAVTAWNSHRGFIIDWGPDADGMQSPRGHRLSCMSSYNREIGIASVRFEKKRYFATCHNFGNNRAVPRFIGGVFFRDANANAYYDLGEGVGGIRITADSGEETQTTASGNFTLPMQHRNACSIRVQHDGQTFTWTYSAGNENVWLHAVVPDKGERQKVDALLLAYETSEKMQADILRVWWKTRHLSMSQEHKKRIEEISHKEVVYLQKHQIICMRIYSQGNKKKAAKVISKYARMYKMTVVSAWFRDAERSLDAYCLTKNIIDGIRARRSFRVGTISKRVSKNKRIMKKTKTPLFRNVLESQVLLLKRSLVKR